VSPDRNSSPPGSSSEKPKKQGCSFTSPGGTRTHRQAIPPGNPRTPNWHVPLGGYEQPARRFLKKSQKRRF